MNRLLEHAMREMEALGYDLKHLDSDPDKVLVEGLLRIVEIWGDMRLRALNEKRAKDWLLKLIEEELLSPLTGKEEEWREVDTSSFKNACSTRVWVNKRCVTVSKDETGKAKNLFGKLFINPRDGSEHLDSDSSVPVEFPYIPKTVYVKEA